MTFSFGSFISLTGDEVFHSTRLSFAFVNLKPVVPGHVLVCPRRVVKRYAELSFKEITDLFKTVQEVGIVIEREFKATSLTFCIQDGPDSGQTVDHVHVHIIPRKKGDYENSDEVYTELAKHDKDGRPSRSLEEMAKEASWLSTFFRLEGR
ncbi:hypothetical protein Zmor_016351 [Zophobas morio]|uniref:bis(5'-adenosyl)-triphosphatase n=2 Tax=Zophobas morio TaxID=2755281 RepID=A0AA38HFF0_9CUCU|nr:hypothetical protein Zmor_016351 [Zophobas morio]